MRCRGQRPDGSSAAANGAGPGPGTRCPPAPELATLMPVAAVIAMRRAATQRDGATAAEDHREPLRRAQPAGDAGAARRRPRSAVLRARSRDPRPHVAGPEGARGAGDGRARAGLRAQRHRLHRQRAARAGHRRSAWSARSRTAAIRSRRAGGSGGTSAAATARTSATTTTSRTRSTASGSTGSSSTRARISRPRTTTLDDAQTGKLDHICRKLRARARRALPRHRLRLGRRSCSARRERYGVDATGITLSKNQFEHVKRRDRRARARRPRARRAARLPRPARGRALRQDREHRHVRARRHRALSASTSARSSAS